MSKNKVKKTSIRNRIVFVSATIMAVALLIIGVGGSAISFTASVLNAQKSFTSVVSVASMTVEHEINAIERVVQELGMNTMLYDASVPKDELTDYLRNKATQYGYTAFYVTDTSGISNTGFDMSSYDFFQAAMRGENYFSEPMITADKTAANIMVSAPIWRDGVQGGEIKGSVCAVISGVMLSDLMTDVEIGETGAMYLIDEEGYTIADVDYSTVLGHENTIKEARSDKTLTAFAQADQSALEGRSAFSTVKYNGETYFLYVMPLSDTGWAIGGMAYATEYVGSHLIVGVITIIATFVVLAINYFVMAKFAKKLSTPIVEMTEASKKIAQGDYEVDIQSQSNDELGDMANNFRSMINANKQVIQDTEKCMAEIAKGNFTITPNAEYVGVFKNIEQAINEITSALKNVMTEIRDTSEQVNVSAVQVSEASMSLSQGASTQAAAVEELAATVHQLSDQVKANADASQNAQSLISEVRSGIENSNVQMQELNSSVKTIGKRADEIHAVIKIIDDIAFQTNILALNAAVEAARAGQAGKGFSVVADEVRNLAAKCASSVQDTSALIEACTEAINEGTKIAEQTATDLQAVVYKTITASDMMNTISDACVDQSMKLTETTTGIEQISDVVQSNSAVSEQSAAASNELSAQSGQLRKMLERFRTKE